MSVAVLLKFLHIVAAIVMIGGVIGREIIRHQMRASDDIQIVLLLAKLVEPFDRLLVVPGSLLVLVFGAILAVMQGWPLFGFLQGAQANWLLVSLVLYLLTIPLVALVFVPRGKIFEAALKAAEAEGRVTPELKAAFHDPIDAGAHRVEEVLIVIVLFLMVVKPF